MPGATKALTLTVSFASEEAASDTRSVPVETPINLVYGGIPFAVMMTTPLDLEDFAYGFSLTEGIIESVADIRSVSIETEERGMTLAIDLVSDRLHAHLARRRALTGRTGCGLCGIDDLDALPRARVAARCDGATISVRAIGRALEALEDAQPLNQETRAVHAAAWADLDGKLVAVREDVGRHNALDKLIGFLLRKGESPEHGFFIVTSRCSFELVEKVAAYGGRALIAISAPTSFALARAKLHNMTLVGIARRDTMTIFHGEERIVQNGSVEA